MNAKEITKSNYGANAKHDGSRYMWMGFAMGLACMAALFIAGLSTGSAGMTVMAASTAAVLAATWSSTAVAAKKKSMSASRA